MKEDEVIEHPRKQLAIGKASTGRVGLTSESRQSNPRKRSLDIGSESEVAKAPLQQRKKQTIGKENDAKGGSLLDKQQQNNSTK